MRENLTQNEKTRFINKVEIKNQCHIWQGSLDKDGYGTFYLRGANRRAHRVAWYSMYGEIPDDHVINHICRNRACVNPQHLQCVTARDNSLKDSVSVGYLNSQKQVCKNGHPFDRVQVWASKTQRVCTICDRARRRESAKKRRAAAKATLRV